MAQYSYKATGQNHQIDEGFISAKTKPEAARLLERRGMTPLVICELTEQKIFIGGIPKIEKITLCRYLSVTLASGLPLTEGIEVLRQETKNTQMKKILSDLSYSLEQGQQLSAIFDRYPDTFESYFVALIKAGEASGKLGDVFHHLESDLRAQYSMESKIKGALLYPAVVFTAMIGIGIMMFFFVLPQIGKVFLNLNLPLPIATKYLFISSIAVSHYLLPILVGMILAGIVGFFVLRQKSVQRAIFSILELIPFVYKLVKQIDLARFSRIFSTLLKSAVPITESLEISLQSLSLTEFRKLVTVVPDEIRKGRTLAGVMKEHTVFPTLLVQMVAAGEKSAQLHATLTDLASYYEEEVEDTMKNMAQILEPVLMLLVGASVGVLILSIIAPIYSVIGTFQQGVSPGSK